MKQLCVLQICFFFSSYLYNDLCIYFMNHPIKLSNFFSNYTYSKICLVEHSSFNIITVINYGKQNIIYLD